MEKKRRSWTATEKHETEIEEGIVHSGHESGYINHEGREIVDPRPMSPPIGFTKQRGPLDLMYDRIRSQLKAEQDDKEFETPEEADDFEIPDELERDLTPYEEHFHGQERHPLEDALADPAVRKSIGEFMNRRFPNASSSSVAPSQGGADPARPGSDDPKTPAKPASSTST